MFFLLYKLTEDGVFDDFPKISDHFPKISEDFPKLFRRPDERSRTFSENFRKFQKMSEDFRRFPKTLRKIRRCFDDTPTNLSTINEPNLISVKSSISSHVKDIVSFLSICYRSVYHWLLYNNITYFMNRNTYRVLNKSNYRPFISYSPKMEHRLEF